MMSFCSRVSVSSHVESCPARSVRESDRDSSGHGTEACPAGTETAAAGPSDATGRLQCGE